MGRKSTKQRIQQFRRDVVLLRKKYAQYVIAERMGTDSGNLSSYSKKARRIRVKIFLINFIPFLRVKYRN